MIHFVEALEIHKPILCGFSDGGIVALLAAIRRSRLFSRLIVCGANLSPKGLKGSVLREIRRSWKKNHNPLDELMLTEPDISEWNLARISIPVLVLAGERDHGKTQRDKKDCVRYSERNPSDSSRGRSRQLCDSLRQAGRIFLI